MPDYTRPPVTAPAFRDAMGEVINYGDRWGSESPPNDSYSVDSNLERFLPLHAIADALIAHLIATYDIEVGDDIAHASKLLHTRTDVERAVHLTPHNTDGAPLTVVYTGFPGVFVKAGALSESHYPVCGCDACDSVWDREATGLEMHLLAVASGHFSETRRPGRTPWFGLAITANDGSRLASSATQMDGVPPERLAAAAATLDSLPEGWKAWSLRA